MLLISPSSIFVVENARRFALGFTCSDHRKTRFDFSQRARSVQNDFCQSHQPSRALSLACSSRQCILVGDSRLKAMQARVEQANLRLLSYAYTILQYCTYCNIYHLREGPMTTNSRPTTSPLVILIGWEGDLVKSTNTK